MLTTTDSASQTYRLEAIGVVRCAASSVSDVPSQGLPSRVEISPRYRRAMTGIETGDDIFVLTIFDKADNDTMAGSPGSQFENGAFSIRSSCRPNRIGMTLSTVTAIDGTTLSFDWLDFCDGTPVIDLKRYNWRWEVIPGTRHLDRRHFEDQIDRIALEEVLIRAAAKFHGERCPAAGAAGRLATSLSRDHGLFIGDPRWTLTVIGDRHLAEAMQILCGATVGNGRLGESHMRPSPTTEVRLEGPGVVVARRVPSGWAVDRIRAS